MSTVDRLAWRTSTRSSDGENCVETAAGAATVHVRDTKLGEASPILTLTPIAWAGFTDAVKDR